MGSSGIFEFQTMMATVQAGMASKMIPAIVTVGYMLMAIALLLAIYEAFAKGGDTRHLVAALFKYIVVAFILANWSQFFADLMTGFNSIAQYIANSYGAGDLAKDWGKQLNDNWTSQGGYPVRMKEDLLPMVHLGLEETTGLLAISLNLSLEEARQIAIEQLTLKGTYTLHSETAKLNGGDFDFDWVCIIESERFPRFVADRFAMKDEHEVKKTKHERSRSPWFNLEFVALKSRGNQIGVITDLMSCCVAADRNDLLYELVAELQKEIDSLKHNVRADRSKLQEIRAAVGSAAWLSLKNAKAVSELPLSIEVATTDRIGNLYNVLRKDIADLLDQPFSIDQFRGLITGPALTEEMFQEVRMVNNVYATGHGVIQTALNEEKKLMFEARNRVTTAIKTGDPNAVKLRKRELAKANASLRRAEDLARDQARSLQEVIAYWGQGKHENRLGWCAALHTIVSRGKGMGSILFHAFPQEVVNAIADRTNGRKTTVQVKDKTGAVIIQDGSFFFVRGLQKTFIFRLDGKTGSLVYTMN